MKDEGGLLQKNVPLSLPIAPPFQSIENAERALDMFTVSSNLTVIFVSTGTASPLGQTSATCGGVTSVEMPVASEEYGDSFGTT